MKRRTNEDEEEEEEEEEEEKECTKDGTRPEVTLGRKEEVKEASSLTASANASNVAVKGI